jgi:hypothetical protein
MLSQIIQSANLSASASTPAKSIGLLAVDA